MHGLMSASPSMRQVEFTMARKPPAFQCYPATLISDQSYRLQTIQERGLHFSMYLECWINIRLPSNPTLLAKMLGFSEGEIKQALTPNVLAFFKKDGGYYISPELEDYRETLRIRNEAKAIGGKKGAEIKRSKNLPKEKWLEGQPTGDPISIAEGPLDKTSQDQNNSKQISNKAVLNADHISWVKDYDNAEDASAYLNKSKGH